MSHDNDSSLHLRTYGSFGRCHRDRDREKDIDLRDKDRSHLVDNGFCDYSDSFMGSRSGKDTLRRSHSMVSGKQVESLPKRPGNDLKNGMLSRVSSISGISKTSFERDFPSLGAEEKPGPPEIGRVSSPGVSSAIQNLPKGIGGNGWTSALVDIPMKVGGNGPLPSFTSQTSVSPGSTASSSSTGLNMAEALAQAPSRVRSPPQLSIDTQRIEERTRIQYSKLIPVTPSMTKSSALNSSEKSKAKGVRSGDLSGPSKVGQQSSQFVNLTLRAPARTDTPKISQVGNFQVLNRERNGISPTAKDGPSLMNPSRVATPLSGVQTASIPSPKSPVKPKLKADSKAGSPSSTHSSFGEKRPTSQAQNRNDFFNFIRKKTPVNHSVDLTESSCVASSCSAKLGEQITGTSTIVNQEKGSSASCLDLEHPVENGNGVTEDGGVAREVPSRSHPDNDERSSSSVPIVPDSGPGSVGESSSGPVLAPVCAPNNFDESPSSDPLVVPSEEELDLLRRLGWDENAEGDALTPEEINDFLRQYEARRTSIRTGQREIRPLRRRVLPDTGSGLALAGRWEMRRVVRAESPEVVEVVRVNESSPESSFRELDDVFLQTQARIWLAEVLHIRFNEEMAIAELLADGELLFQVSKIVWKMLLKKYPELKHSKVYIYERTSFGKSDRKYMPYPKVDSFLKVCQILGLTSIDLFSPSDVVEKRDIRRVCMCIRSLSKKARLKNLRVPDFDVVTYTIVMPTDLRSSSGNHAQNHDSNSESDEAESSFSELEFQSPRSNASYDASTLFNIVGGNFLEGNSVDDENFSQMHMEFNMDSQECHEDGQKRRLHGEIMLTELADFPHASVRKNDNHNFIEALNCKSFLSHNECRTYQGARTSFAQMGDIKYPNCHKSGEEIHSADINCFQTYASCFEDSTSGSDKKLNVNGEEAYEGYVGSVLRNINDKNLFAKCTTSNTCTDLDNEKEDFAKASIGAQAEIVHDSPGEDNVQSDCVVWYEDVFNDCFKCVPESHDRKPRSSDIIQFLDGEYDLPPRGCIDVAGNEELKHDGNFVDRKTSPADFISHQAGFSDLNVYSMDNSNFLNSDSVVLGGSVSMDTDNLDSNCRGIKYVNKRKPFEEDLDSEIPSTAEAHGLSENAATEDKLNKYDCTTTDLHDRERNEDKDLLTPKSCCLSVKTAGINRTSLNGIKLPPVPHPRKPVDFLKCDTKESQPGFKTEDGNPAGSLSSNADKQDVCVGIGSQYHNPPHADSAYKSDECAIPAHSDVLSDSGTTEGKNQGATGTIMSDGCSKAESEDALSQNVWITHIGGTSGVAVSGVPDNRDVSTSDSEMDAIEQPDDSTAHKEDTTYGHPMSCPKHESVTNFNFHGVKSQLIAGSFDTTNEGGLKDYLIEQKDSSCFHPCEACKDLMVEIKQDVPEQQCAENCLNCYTQGGSISDFSTKCSSQLIETENDDECCVSSSEVEDSCARWMKPLSSSCRGSSQQLLSVEQMTLRHLHSSMPNDRLAICDFDSSCQQQTQQTVVDPSDNTYLPMGNDIMQRETSGSLGIDCVDGSEFNGSEKRGTGVTENSKAPCTCYPNELDGSEFVDTHNAGPESPGQGGDCEIVSMYESASYDSFACNGDDQRFQDNILQTQENLPFSPPGCAAEGEENNCIEQISEGAGESEKELVTTLVSTGKRRDGTTGQVHRPGNIILKSVAGGITLVGSLFLLLHLRYDSMLMGRRKRDKEKNVAAVVPLQIQKAGMEGSAQKKVEMGKSDSLYPGERLKF
ncbi:hypothetical protein COCNU_scaffold024428G000010 [Cocos nucifera]|nr:hypothetical protein [Cocos nucifera]